MRDQGNDDVADRIEQHHQDVAISNRDAAAENKILKNESEEIRNNRKSSNTADAELPPKVPESSIGDSKGGIDGDTSRNHLHADTPSDLPPTKQQKLSVDSPDTTRIGPGILKKILQLFVCGLDNWDSKSPDFRLCLFTSFPTTHL
jgi:hypothetical protein